MNFKIACLVLIIILTGFFSVKAQEVEENIWMIKPFKADGQPNEWEEPLNQYNDATKLAFAIANDDKNLYIIIESLDPKTTFNVLRGGITLNINIQGKKKDGFKLIFPLMDRSAMQMKGEISEKEGVLLPNDNQNIRISGFKNIKDGNLPVGNEAGIESGMNIYPNRDLVYELSIPLVQLGVDLNMNKPIIYNVKINQRDKPDFKKGSQAQHGEGRTGGRGGMNGRQGGGMGGSMGNGGKMNGGNHRFPGEGIGDPENKKSDFWIKYKLVKS